MNDQLKDTKNFSEGLNLTYYKSAVQKSIALLSRTVSSGEIVTSANTEKEKSLITDARGSKIIDIYIANIDNTIEQLWSERAESICSTKLDEIIREAYKSLHKGVISENSFLRTGVQKHNRVAPVQHLNTLYQMFLTKCCILEGEIHEDSTKREIVAYIAYSILRDHYFVDGCGKMSVLIPAYFCIHFGLPLPKISSKSDHEVNPERNEYYFPNTSKYNEHLQRWVLKYTQLFD